MNILEFGSRKREGRKISMVTCYDHWSAKILAQSDVDCVLVGDSVAMVVHGHPSTVQATTEMMKLHVAAVARGLAAERGKPGHSEKLLIADMPFLSFRKGVVAALECAGELMAAGAQAVKLESVRGHEDVIEALVHSGIPVMGHIGLTPQFINQFGGFKVQGKNDEAARGIVEQARALERLGAFAIVIECVPSKLAAEITQAVGIATIGIGAGATVDGQVLVLQDLLGMDAGFKPKFLRKYLEGHASLRDAVNRFDADAKGGRFPSESESYL